MTRDRLVSLFVVLTAVAVGAVVWVLTQRHERTVVHERARTATTPVIVEIPPTTPLRDAGPRNNARRGSSFVNHESRSTPATGSGPKSQNRPLSPHKRKTPKTPRKTRPSRPRPVYTPPASGSTPPPAKQCPPVNATAPLPVTITTPLVAVNC